MDESQLYEPEPQPSALESRISEIENSALESRISQVEGQLKNKKKDLWDKLTATSTLVSGIIVAGIGFYATQVYDQRSRDTEQADKTRGAVAVELQTVEKFFPHLASKDDTERQAAIEAISSLGNPDLAAKMAKVFGGPGARAALTNIAASATSSEKATVEPALADLYKEFSLSVVWIQVSTNDFGAASSGFLVSSDGYILTAANMFAPASGARDLVITVHSEITDQSEVHASLIKSDAQLNVALLKVPNGVRGGRPAKISSSKVGLGDRVVIVGFNGDHRSASAGAVFANDNGKLVVNAAIYGGMLGSPIFDSSGEVIGIVTGGGRADQPRAIAVPIQSIRSMLEIASVASQP